jgi:hypothetical protein
MTLRQIEEEVRDQRRVGAAGDVGGGNLGAAHAAGQSLFEAADAAISRALSGDSKQFNEMVEQEGGE